MKTKITQLVLWLLFLSFSYAQNPGPPIVSEGFAFNPDKKTCLTDEQRSDLFESIKVNIEALKLQNQLSFSAQRRGGHPLFIWPIQKANDVNFNEIYSVYNYVDHNTGFPNQLTDYNCGTRTYDTTGGYNHKGVDIVTWPFPWKMMEDDGVEIIAAASGQIIFIRDGEFDLSCTQNTTTPWNIVVIQHSDGSVALYGHMKNGSTTTKNVGDMVTEGEYLGIVGSSGQSDIPHLHFEVYENEIDGVPTGLIDPYSGSCNSMNSNSWWQTQRPYNDPGINAVLTHSDAPVVFPACPTSETPNLSNDFETDDLIYFTVFLKDQTAGDNISLEILRPDNSSLFGNWNETVQTTAYTWYYLWNYTGVFDMVGEWTWRVTFGGETVSHTFNVTNALTIEENDFSETSIYPNPFNDVVNITSTAKIKKANIVDMLGKIVLKVEAMSEEGLNELNLIQLSKGMYFVTLEGEGNEMKTFKLIKK